MRCDFFSLRIRCQLISKMQEKKEVHVKKIDLTSWRWWLGLKEEMVMSKPINNYGITVIVPAYNEEKSIAETILSIQAQTVQPNEIIIIDDCSSDRTGEIASVMGVTVVKTEFNQGAKATAQKYVLERGFVKTELFITIDADTLLAPDVIERTLSYFNDPLTASVCGYVIPARIESIWERGRFIEYVFSISLFKMAQNHLGSVVISSGCFTVFRTDLVLKMGGFNTLTMAEDMYLTWQLSMAGYRIYCDNKAFCYPFDPPTFKIFVAQLDRWYRSFFQNLAIHWSDLLKYDRKLAAFTFGYLLDGSMFAIGLMWGLLYSIVNIPYVSLIMTLMLDTAIVSTVCIIEGIRIGRLHQVLLCLPAYQITRLVGMFVFWRSMWKEWIVGDRLKLWVKGH